jgi:hypothetical protein
MKAELVVVIAFPPLELSATTLPETVTARFEAVSKLPPDAVLAPLVEIVLTTLTALKAAVKAAVELAEKLMGIVAPLTVLIFVLSVA